MTHDAAVGVLNIDKPQDLTSHDVVNRVRRLLGIRRVGHAGTLDPLATGVLLVCVGAATRIAEYLQAGHKIYAVTVRLGEETDTYDAAGKLVASRPVPAFSRASLEQTVASFLGDILQRPPIFSALKRGGRPAYELARAGVEINLEPRPVSLLAIEIIDWQTPDLTLQLSSSPGFYVRSLAHDIGQALGCGAHVRSLRRLASGTWRVEEAVTLEILAAAGDGWAAFLHGLPAALAMLPALVLPTGLAYRFALGQAAPLPALQPEGIPPLVSGAEWRVFAPPEQFIGIGRVDLDHDQLLPHKIFCDPTTLIISSQAPNPEA